MFEPNSQRSARCHLSEMNLTRQGLVTFLREEMREAVQLGVESRGPEAGRLSKDYQPVLL